MNTTPKALTSVGKITAWRWFTHSSCAISMNSGMTPSWDGTIIVATTRMSRNELKRKRELREREARERAEEHRADRDRARDDQRVQERLPMSTWSRALLMFFQRCGPG